MLFDMFEEFDIPSGWERVKIGEIADFNKESWKKNNSPSEIYYIDIKSLSDEKIEPPKHMAYADSPSRARRVVKNGDIIISTVRPNLKQFTLLEGREEVNLTASTGFCVISAKDEDYRWYIYSIITSEFFTRYLERVAEGAAYPAFKPKDIAESIIAIPPKRELKVLANIASSVYRKIAVNSQENLTLEKIAQRIFKAWFVDFAPVKANADGVAFDGISPEIQSIFPSEFEESDIGRVPKGWETKPLASVVSIIGGGTPKKSVPEYWNGDINWFSVQDTPKQSDIFVFETKEKITELGLNKSSTKLLPKGTTIITARGTVGKLALVADPLCMNQSCYGLKGVNLGDVTTYHYIKLAISTLKANVHGAVFDTITTDTFSACNLVFPPNNLTDLFEKLSESLYSKIETNVKQSATLKSIRDRLIPKLLTGQLPYDMAENAHEIAS